MKTHLVEILRSGLASPAGVEGSLSPVDAGVLQHEAPDAHWCMFDGADRLVARCSLWWTNSPSYPGKRLGLIGHYAAVDEASGTEVGRHACQQLLRQGCTMAVGPMDGSTWRRYRFVTERGTEPPFFLEPDNPDEWPRYFAALGFTPIAGYTSALDTDLSREDGRASTIKERLLRAGITLRPASDKEMEDELRRIYMLSLRSFQSNFLYTPLEATEFLTQYRKVLPYVRSEFVLLAEREGALVGFLFGIPDMLRPQYGKPNDTLIIKTVAVAPEYSSIGLGTLLVSHARRKARELGLERCIHALIHESNRSCKISDKTGVTMRRYTLFAKPLAP